MSEINDSAKTMTAPRSRAQRKRAAADATARWRGMRRAAGMPEAHVVDRALSEAVVFCMRPRYALRDGDDSVYVSMNRIFRTATLILVKAGAGRDLAQAAIKARLQPRRAHTGASNVPSVRMASETFVPAPRRKGLEWHERDLETMRKAAEPLEITQYDPVTQVSTRSDNHAVMSERGGSD